MSKYRECHIQPDWLLIHWIEEDILVYGHNHIPANHEVRNGKIVAQVGTLGMHNNGIGKPQYTIITCENGKASLEVRTIDYDKEELKKRIQKRRWVI